MFVPTELRKDVQINAAVRTVLKELYPSVKHIRYSIGKDWSDEWAIFFRVMLSDEAMDSRRWSDVTERLMDRMMQELDLPNLGLWPYFDFRMEAEQAELRDPEWAALA